LAILKQLDSAKEPVLQKPALGQRAQMRVTRADPAAHGWAFFYLFQSNSSVSQRHSHQFRLVMLGYDRVDTETASAVHFTNSKFCHKHPA
jgi:hypothetical protein